MGGIKVIGMEGLSVPVWAGGGGRACWLHARVVVEYSFTHSFAAPLFRSALFRYIPSLTTPRCLSLSLCLVSLLFYSGEATPIARGLVVHQADSEDNSNVSCFRRWPLV